MATMTAARPGCSGWIAVCERHREAAERNGYEVRTVVTPSVAEPTASGESTAAPYPADPTSPAPVSRERDGLATLDAMLDVE